MYAQSVYSTVRILNIHLRVQKYAADEPCVEWRMWGQPPPAVHAGEAHRLSCGAHLCPPRPLGGAAPRAAPVSWGCLEKLCPDLGNICL
jgi:hypothetical protein